MDIFLPVYPPGADRPCRRAFSGNLPNFGGDASADHEELGIPSNKDYLVKDSDDDQRVRDSAASGWAVT